jgi:hypothetical protein
MAEDCLHLSIWVPQQQPPDHQQHESRRRMEGQRGQPEDQKEAVNSSDEYEDVNNAQEEAGGQTREKKELHMSEEQLEDTAGLKSEDKVVIQENSSGVNDTKEGLAVLVWMTAGKNKSISSWLVALCPKLRTLNLKRQAALTPTDLQYKWFRQVERRHAWRGTGWSGKHHRGQVQRYSGTVVQWYSGTGAQGCSGTGVQAYMGTGVHWYSGTVVRWSSGTVVQWYFGTLIGRVVE